MSHSGVNKFGGSGNRPRDFTVGSDNKFITLSHNLATKVNKSGDSMTGDFELLLGDDRYRTFGVTDLTKSGQTISLLLGSRQNQIFHSFNSDLVLLTSRGVKIVYAQGDVCLLGGLSDAKAKFFQDILMNGNSISFLKQPIDPQDTATKKYVDDKFDAGFTPGIDAGGAVGLDAGGAVGSDAGAVGSVIGSSLSPAYPHADEISYRPVLYNRNSAGYIPNILSCNSKAGFSTAASHRNIASYRPFSAAPNLEWDTGPLPSGNTAGEANSIPLNVWFQIKLNVPTKIHKIAVREKHSPSPSDKIRGWKLLGSEDGLTFDTLLEISDNIDPSNAIDQTTKFFNIPPLPTQRFADTGGRLIPAKASHPAYLYYRFKIDHPGPTNPGINYFQIFSLDTIISDYIE